MLRYNFSNFYIHTNAFTGILKRNMWLFSFKNLHELAGRNTQEKMMMYKLSLKLYKTFNYHIPLPDWINLNYNIIHTTRQTCFITQKKNDLKHLSGTPSQETGIRPPSCLYLDNRLCMSIPRVKMTAQFSSKTLSKKRKGLFLTSW